MVTGEPNEESLEGNPITSVEGAINRLTTEWKIMEEEDNKPSEDSHGPVEPDDISLGSWHQIDVEHSEGAIIGVWNEEIPDEIKDDVVEGLKDRGQTRLVELFTSGRSRDWHKKETE
ncbi:MAG: hypothetical protein Q7S37_05300 [bacterium]|nr:hypothetical protein [bacterium]